LLKAEVGDARVVLFDEEFLRKKRLAGDSVVEVLRGVLRIEVTVRGEWISIFEDILVRGN